MLERSLLGDPIDCISEYIGLSPKKVKRYKEIDFERAVKRFLPRGTLEKMIEDGVIPDARQYDMDTRDGMIKHHVEGVLCLIKGYEILKPYFETSKRGMEWFSSNFYDSTLCERLEGITTRNAIEQIHYLRQLELIEISKRRFERYVG